MDAKCGSAGVSNTIDTLSARAGGNWLATAHSTSRLFRFGSTRQKWCLCRDFGIWRRGRIVHYFLKGRFSNAPRHENLIWPLYIAVIGTIYVAVTAPTGRFMVVTRLSRSQSWFVVFSEFGPRHIAQSSVYVASGLRDWGRFASLLRAAPKFARHDSRSSGRWHLSGYGFWFLVPHRVIPINLHRPEPFL